MRLLELWKDFEDVGGNSGRMYYRIATVTWSDPIIWQPSDRQFPVPSGWAGKGGIYAFIRRHGRQLNGQRIAYIGKANNFSTRLQNTHSRFEIVRRKGQTLISCGRIAFDRIRSRTGYYEEIEDIIKFAVYDYVENLQGFESLPGFRAWSPRVMVPWVIRNEGYNFEGLMPARIAYPAIAIED